MWSAWEAKNQLLNLIWGILNDNKPKNKNEAGLHCGASGQAGAAKELCDLLIKLRTKSKKEEAELKKEEITINTYIKNVTEYKCNCTFDDWDGDFGQCAGPKVEKVDIYETCENAETMKESEGNLKEQRKSLMTDRENRVDEVIEEKLIFEVIRIWRKMTFHVMSGILVEIKLNLHK